MSLPKRKLNIFIVAGEKSGDDLGGKLIPALRVLAGEGVEFSGIGGEAMQAQGLNSIFPLSDIAVMGLTAVLARLPSLIRRVYQTVAAIGAQQPDAVVLIDSPDFTHAVAKRVRRKWPHIPLIDYVSPTVWAWRPGRARKMRGYFDHVLAVLPFEPEAHARLGGPPCTYVGHPLIERLEELRPDAAEHYARAAAPPQVVVLPGSRRSEISRLMDDFGAAVAQLAMKFPQAEFVLPAVDHVESLIVEKMAHWPIKPQIVRGEAAKYAAFRRARVALAASGTVTLELALAQVPMVVAYKVAPIEEPLRHLVKVSSIVLPNLILGQNAVPEFLQEKCRPELLAGALAELVPDTSARAAQMSAFAQLAENMSLSSGTPADAAARIILSYARKAIAAPALHH